MFQQLNLTLLNTSQNKIIFIIAMSIALVGLISMSILDSCEIKYVSLLTDINDYEQTLDPNFCYSLLERITSFNEFCEIQLEILDCG